jgi:hypothetical protein
MHALNRTVKRWLWGVVVWWCCSGCAIQSGVDVVAMQPAADTWAWAVSFVGSAGDTQRVLTGLAPQQRYRMEVQARIVTGHLRLTYQPQPPASPLVLHVYPNRMNALTAEVTSDALGQIIIHENSYDARGGEYQVWLYTIVNQ